MPVKVLGVLHICDSLQKNDSERQKRVANRRGGVVVNGTKHNFLDDEKEAMIMTGLISIWGGRGRPVRTHKREGGGMISRFGPSVDRPQALRQLVHYLSGWECSWPRRIPFRPKGHAVVRMELRPS